MVEHAKRNDAPPAQRPWACDGPCERLIHNVERYKVYVVDPQSGKRLAAAFCARCFFTTYEVVRVDEDPNP